MLDLMFMLSTVGELLNADIKQLTLKACRVGPGVHVVYNGGATEC